MRHIKITVTGTVQGVFFRKSTKERALALGVKGFVCNQRDGSVYVEAEGDEEAITAFAAWCQQGPSRARVEAVKVKAGELIHFSGFEIR